MKFVWLKNNRIFKTLRLDKELFEVYSKAMHAIQRSELRTSIIQKLDADFEWWTIFDENCFYNTGTTIYLSVDRGYSILDADELSCLEDPDDELSELLNFFTPPTPCAFVFPWIYNHDSDGDDEEDE